jgi:pimeloyl-ACP methyl ester carboxylesterase
LATVRTDVELLTALADMAVARGSDVEAFGSASQGWQRIREKLSRIRSAVPSGAARAAGKVGRPMFHDQAATFIGDVLVYLARPGIEDRRTAIIAAVDETIEAASKQRTDEDPLVVIAHSMGGNIVYDLLSSERPDLKVDTFVTVGSQVGLFQELNLFTAQHPELDPPRDRVPKPANIGRWINVYDRNDMLGFAVSRIFEDTVDYEYGTGRGMLRAHSSYFIRPSFYERLAARLAAEA